MGLLLVGIEDGCEVGVRVGCPVGMVEGGIEGWPLVGLRCALR